MIKLQILGAGCAKCDKLYENAEFALREACMEFEIEKVTDPLKIADFGIVMTPALVIDGEIKSSGKVASVLEIKRLIGYKQTCSCC